MPKVLDVILAQFKGDISEIIEQMDNGKFTANDLEDAMADAIVEHNTAALMAGLGVRTLDERAIEALDKVVEFHYSKLAGFVDEVADDGWESSKHAARLNLYAGSAKHSYALGDTDLHPLPGYPAQDTDCLTNCGCEWDRVTIDAEAGDYDYFWVRGKDDSCDTCLQRADDWAPFPIRGHEAG